LCFGWATCLFVYLNGWAAFVKHKFGICCFEYLFSGMCVRKFAWAGPKNFIGLILSWLGWTRINTSDEMGYAKNELQQWA